MQDMLHITILGIGKFGISLINHFPRQLLQVSSYIALGFDSIILRTSLADKKIKLNKCTTLPTAVKNISKKLYSSLNESDFVFFLADLQEEYCGEIILELIHHILPPVLPLQ